MDFLCILIQMIAWAMFAIGAAYAVVATILILLTQRQKYLRALRMLFWLTPVIGLLLMGSHYIYLGYWRHQDLFAAGLTYVPADHELFSGESGYPSTPVANHMVTELRVSTAAYLLALVAAAILPYVRERMKRDGETPPLMVTVWELLTAAGVVAMVSWGVYLLWYLQNRGTS